MTTDYKTRLPNQFENATNLRALIDVCSDMFAESNVILAYLRDNNTVDAAVGVWLDEIGEIVGAPRGANQREDATIFAYRDVGAADDTAKAFSLVSYPAGGHYVGIDGIPDGTAFNDTDYRALIRAKVVSTFSGDSIPEIWSWINLVFDVDPFVYDGAPGEVSIELAEYMPHTQRRILEKYVPRAAGVSVTIVSWPPEGA